MHDTSEERRWDRSYYFGAFSAVALFGMYVLQNVFRPAVMVLGLLIALALFYVGCRLVRHFFLNSPKAMKSSFWVLLVMTPLFMFFGSQFLVYALTTRAPDVSEILGDGRLPLLPKHASGIRTFAWHGMFTGVEYLSFKAPADDIDQWLQSWGEFSEQVPVSLPLVNGSPGPSSNWTSSKSPAWFCPHDQMTGRWFSISTLDRHNGGEVLVDDETNTVYIRVIWS